MSFFEALKSLFPDGAAFRFFSGKQSTQLIEALAEKPDDIKTFFDQVRDSGIPGRIPSAALSDWENFYLLQNIGSLTNAERNARIKARFDRVGAQGVDSLEDTLNDEFDNFLTYFRDLTRCGKVESTCGAVLATCGAKVEDTTTDLKLEILENGIKHNPALIPGLLIIRDIDDDRVELPSDSTLWPFIWFITGPEGLGSFLTMDLIRKTEFITAVLQVKPVNTWVIAQINFV